MVSLSRTAGVVLVLALFGVAHAAPIIPHMDPQAAKAQIEHRRQSQHTQSSQSAGKQAPPHPQRPVRPMEAATAKAAPTIFAAAASIPLMPSPSTTESRRAAFEAYRARLTADLASRREDELHKQYPHAGPWEMIADHEYGVRVMGGDPAHEPVVVPPHGPFVPQPIHPTWEGTSHVPPGAPAKPTLPTPAPAPTATPTPAPATPAVPVSPVPVAVPKPTPPPPPSSGATEVPPVKDGHASSDPAPAALPPPAPPIAPRPGFAERLSGWMQRLKEFRDRWVARIRSRQSPETPPPKPQDQPSHPPVVSPVPAPASTGASDPLKPAEVKPQSTAAPIDPATHSPSGKPYMSVDEVMHEIGRFNAIIAANKAKRAALEARAKQSASTAAAPTEPPKPKPTRVPDHSLSERVAIAKASFAAANAHRRSHMPMAAAVGVNAQEHTWEPRAMGEYGRGFHSHRHHHPSVFKRPTNPNEPIQFALKFTGSCETKPNNTDADEGSDGAPQRTVPICRLRATSQELVTTIHPHHGVDMSIHKLIGSQAHLVVYNVDILSETAFTASGNVSFGSTREKPHVLRFATAGPARILKLKDGERSFTAQFQVHEGESEFEGAQGSITMNGRLKSLNRVEALVTGVVFKASALQARRMRLVEHTLRELNDRRMREAEEHRKRVPKAKSKPTDSPKRGKVTFHRSANGRDDVDSPRKRSRNRRADPFEASAVVTAADDRMERETDDIAAAAAEALATTAPHATIDDDGDDADEVKPHARGVNRKRRVIQLRR